MPNDKTKTSKIYFFSSEKHTIFFKHILASKEIRRGMLCFIQSKIVEGSLFLPLLSRLSQFCSLLDDDPPTSHPD